MRMQEDSKVDELKIKTKLTNQDTTTIFHFQREKNTNFLNKNRNETGQLGDGTTEFLRVLAILTALTARLLYCPLMVSVGLRPPF